MRKRTKFCLLLIIVLVFAFSLSAQGKKKAGRVEDFKFTSKLMSREMPYRVIFPSTYNRRNKDTVYPVIYFLHGLTGHFDNWTDKTKLAQYASDYQFLIVMPEGNDGWYSDSVSLAGDKYETYLIQELVSEIDRQFRTTGKREGRIITGLSMGGYGALKFALKYPEKFLLAGSFSGVLDAALNGQNNQFLKPSIMSVFGEANNPVRRENDIFQMIAAIETDKIKQLPFLYFSCGTEDWLIKTNRDFADLLIQRKIPHEYRQLPGKHDWKYWDAQAEEFLRLAQRVVK